MIYVCMCCLCTWCMHRVYRHAYVYILDIVASQRCSFGCSLGDADSNRRVALYGDVRLHGPQYLGQQHLSLWLSHEIASSGSQALPWLRFMPQTYPGFAMRRDGVCQAVRLVGPRPGSQRQRWHNEQNLGTEHNLQHCKHVSQALSSGSFPADKCAKPFASISNSSNPGRCGTPRLPAAGRQASSCCRRTTATCGRSRHAPWQTAQAAEADGNWCCSEFAMTRQQKATVWQRKACAVVAFLSRLKAWQQSWSLCAATVAREFSHTLSSIVRWCRLS